MKIIIFVSILILFCCCSKTKEEVEIVVFNKATHQSFFELVDEMKLIPLELNSKYLLGNINTLYHVDSTYYLVDMYQSHIIYRYTTDGVFLNTIGVVGKGPGEYNVLSDCYIDENEDDVIILSTPNLSLNFYSKSGEFKYDKFNVLNVHKFIKEKNNFLFHSSYDPNTDKQLFIFDSSLNLIRTADPFKKHPIHFTGEQLFFKYKDAIYLKSDFETKILIIDNEKFRVKYQFDFGEFNIPDSFYNMDEMFNAFEFLNSKGFTTMKKFYINDHHSIIIAPRQNKTMHDVCVGIKNHDTNKWSWLTFDENDYESFIFNSLGFTKDNYFVCALSGFEIDEIKNKSKIINIHDFDLKERETDTFLLLCKLK